MEKINWLEWQPKAFKIARRKNKPILLDINASWCHWCRVMENTTYSDLNIIETINADFVAIKVDTDRRPDINSRYNLGGWPTTAFLQPDGAIITGSTFVGTDDMAFMLAEVKHHYLQVGADEKPEAFPEAGTYSIDPPPSGDSRQLSNEVASHFLDLAVHNYDRTHGGFGVEPKFTMTSALRLILAHAFSGRNELLEILTTTLTRMARSEIFDQIDGGFFRYAANRDWTAPHREKLLTDQADLASLYMDTFCVTGDRLFADVATKTLDYIEANLVSKNGRFFGSQAADDFYYRLPLRERRKIRTPPVDRTSFADSSARACSSFIKANSLLNRPGAAALSLKTLNFLYDHMTARSGLFYHFYDGEKPGEEGLLSDQIEVLATIIDAYEASANLAFVSEARSLAQNIVKRFMDSQTPALKDRLPSRGDIGALRFADFRIEGNAKAGIALVRLAKITGDESFADSGRTILGAFSNTYKHFGLLAADYADAVNWLFAPGVEVFLTGDRKAGSMSRLWQAARFNYHPRKVIIIDGHRSLKTSPAPAARKASPAAVLCVGTKCLGPTSDPEELSEHIKRAA